MAEPEGFTTKLIHTQFAKTDVHNSLNMPIYGNAAFEFATAEQMEEVFSGRSTDHSYTRISNPTVENLELRIKSVSGANTVTAVSSGMAAVANTFMTIAWQGANIVTSQYLFGNTYVFFNSTLREFGVEVRFVNLTDYEAVEKLVDQNTCAIFFETITNPQLEIVDIAKLADIAQRKNVPLISDSTLTPPNIFRARDFGVNLEIISSTKVISGGATSVGGLILDHGTYNWAHSPKLAGFEKRFGLLAFHAKLRKEIFRNFGACMSPFTAYLQTLGLETLQLRFNAAAQNCLQLANYLGSLPEVASVNYPGLPSSQFHEIGKLQFGEFPGTVLAFSFHTKDAAFNFVNKLRLIKRSTKLSDNKSLIIHPASTIYVDFGPERRAELQIGDAMLRLSVGIENFSDLVADINAAIAASC
jgi:O-acetylhomoserine (thiol)-lyase